MNDTCHSPRQTHASSFSGCTLLSRTVCLTYAPFYKMGSMSEDGVTRRTGYTASRRRADETSDGLMNEVHNNSHDGTASFGTSSSPSKSSWSRRRKKSNSPRRSKLWQSRLTLFLQKCIRGDGAFACVSCLVLSTLLALAAVCFVYLTSLETEGQRPPPTQMLHNVPRRHTRSEKARKRKKTPFFIIPKFEITFRVFLSGFEMKMPGKMGPSQESEINYPDFGNLHHLEFFEEEGARRQIYRDMQSFVNEFREPFLPQDDDTDGYYAYDDDAIRSSHGVVVGHQILEDKLCRRTADHRRNLQNCNNFHENGLIENHAKALGHGAFRSVFGLTRSYGDTVEQIAVKDIKFDRPLYDHDLEYTRVDANIAELLTASPRIYDIYGHCGIGIMSEWFPHGDLEEAAIDYDDYPNPDEIHENEKKKELVVYNNITSREKLRISLHMAEALADLHGYKNGVIVHQDVQLSQFLLNKDMTRLKLNDFNRAEFMLWDEEGQEYCLYSAGAAHGNWRSAEEYEERNHNEQIDVFSLGNNMYGVLTGLEPFYDEHDDYDNVRVRVRKGEKAYVDPRYKERSLAEAKLAEIIDMCHEFEPSARPTIFEVVKFLRQAMKEVDEAERNKKLKAKMRDRITQSA